jgi:hypothetical protein
MKNNSKHSNNVLMYGIYGHKIKNLKYFVKNIKFAKQRITRGYADCDVWDFDKYLYSVIKGGLSTLSDIAVGYPSKYEDFESWKSDLLRVASLIDDVDMDSKIDEYFDVYGGIDKKKYYEAYTKSELNKTELFQWLREHIDNLWD